MNKLYPNKITFSNNSTPALNASNLNRMSQALADIDDRVIEGYTTAMEAIEILQQCETYADNAEASATSAGSSATSASTSASEASASATSASNSATSASTSASEASASATSASGSATSASESATSASSSASEASASATAAGESATSASTSASEASASATSASTSATEASTSATNASTSASEASASATSASQSSTAAGQSATDAEASYQRTRAIEIGLGHPLIPMGTTTFENVPDLSGAEVGWMYNISNDFTTTSDFEEGAGLPVSAGANIYKSNSNKWDLFAGLSSVVVDSTLSKTSTNPISNSAVATELENLGKSVSDGKTLVAEAITENGTATASDATFATMATNIGMVASSKYAQAKTDYEPKSATVDTSGNVAVKNDAGTTILSTTTSNSYNAGVSATKVGTASASQVMSGYTFTSSSGVGQSGSLSISSVTPSNTSPKSLSSGSTYKMSSSGYAISSYSSVTPTSDGAYFSSGMRLMSGSGYAYSSQPSSGATIVSSSAPTSASQTYTIPANTGNCYIAFFNYSNASTSGTLAKARTYVTISGATNCSYEKVVALENTSDNRCMYVWKITPTTKSSACTLTMQASSRCMNMIFK